MIWKDCCPLSFLSFGHWNAAGRYITSSVTLWSVVGLLMVADCVYYTAIKLRKGRRGKKGRLFKSACEKNTDDIPALHHYWIQLSCAILQSPRILLGDKGSCRTLPVASDVDFPEAVVCLWEGRVQYALDEREVLALLQHSARRSEVLDKDEIMISAASLALLWRLQLVRVVHDAVVVAEDVGECSDTLSDLDEYSSLFYHSFIQPLGEFFLPSSLMFAECWSSLSEELHELRRWRFKQQLRNILSLAKYVYTTGLEKMFSCFMITALAALATRSASAGLAVREKIEILIGVVSRIFFFSLTDSSNTSLHIVAKTLASLLAFEWARLVATTAVMHVTHDYIRSAASSHRCCVKRHLYEALVQTPLSFFDMRDFGDIEELMNYANDLEGVDVHVHEFITGMVRAVTVFATTTAALDGRSCAVVVATVAGSDMLTYALKSLRRRCAEDGIDDGEEVDMEEVENANITSDGIMLRGMEIIEHIHELRPYGADAALMTWWIEHTEHYCKKGATPMRCLLRLLSRLRLLWSIDALMTLVRWLLPIIVTTHAATTFQTREVLLEAMASVRGVFDSAFDVPRVVEVVLNNAYKANKLERLLDPRHWEEKQKWRKWKSQESLKNEKERGCEVKRCLVTTTSNTTTTSVDIMDNYAKDNDYNFVDLTGSGLDAFLRENESTEVVKIRADCLQFQYPSSPTVDAFRHPVSFDLRLQDEVTGIGRFVCITGPSGCGKTTLLRLLLAMYTTECKGSLKLQLRGRGCRKACLQPSKHEGDDRGKRSGCDEESYDGCGDAQWFPVASITRNFLRSKLFGFVPQTATLFSGATIAHNISLHNHVSLADAALLEEVRRCAGAAGCAEFIDRLPRGPLTPLAGATGWVAPGAVRLSCGQGQRLMLARALFSGGGVLLMDEPTSGLDAATKSAVIAQLRLLLRSGRLRGVLCVTHDQDVLGQADHVVRL